MDFNSITKTRQSCRAFDATRIPGRSLIEDVLATARLSPSACNSQPYHFWVAMGENAKKIGACTRSMDSNLFTEDCPVFIAISEENYNSHAASSAVATNQDYRSVDIGIAAAYLTARATELGLDSCILGWFDEEQTIALLGTAQRVRLIIALGYAKEGDVLRNKKRKTQADLITWL